MCCRTSGPCRTDRWQRGEGGNFDELPTCCARHSLQQLSGAAVREPHTGSTRIEVPSACVRACVCVCVCACVRACLLACVRACVRACMLA